MILFIDYDDTLHPSWTFHGGAQRVTAKPYTGPWLVEAPTLERILRPYLPRLEIVISSLWARTKGLETARGMLPPTLANRVVGSIWLAESPHRLQPRTRYDAIRAWLDEQRPAHGAWLALDDDDREWPAHERHRLVHAKGTLGDPKVQHELAEKLAAQMKLTKRDVPPDLDRPDLGPAHRAALLEILEFAEGLTGDRDRAIELLRSRPLRAFDGLTAVDLAAQGRAADVLAYLESIAGGAAG